MSKRESIARYTLIIQKLRKHPATFNEISDFLVQKSEIQQADFNISKRTFQRDIDDILELFGIEIEYDFSQRVYVLKEESDVNGRDRMLEAFDLFNALNIADNFNDYIEFEKRKPAGTEHLYGLLHAIKNKLIVKFQYEKFWDEEISDRVIEPYSLKEFKYRWYLLGKDCKNVGIRTFALDRMEYLEITTRHYKVEKPFNVSEYFKNSFGIIAPNGQKPAKIILSFDRHQGRYIKSLPFHHSQKILIENDKELRIQLNICITYDFLMELLSYGENVEVVKPKLLIHEMRNAFQKAIDLYS